MILTPEIIARLAVLGALVVIAQVVCFSKMDVFGSDPDVLLLVVFSVGVLGGSLTGAVFGFSVGLLMDCLLLETLGGFALTLLSVGYVAGRYREAIGRPTRGAVPLLGAALTLLGALVIAAIQIGTGVDANVSFLVVRDAIVTSLIGAALAIPVLLGVRLVVRSALVDERRAARAPDRGAGHGDAIATMYRRTPESEPERRTSPLVSADLDPDRDRDRDLLGPLPPPLVRAGPLRRQVPDPGERQPHPPGPGAGPARRHPRPQREGAGREPHRTRARGDPAGSARTPAPDALPRASICSPRSPGCRFSEIRKAFRDGNTACARRPGDPEEGPRGWTRSTTCARTSRASRG